MWPAFLTLQECWPPYSCRKNPTKKHQTSHTKRQFQLIVCLYRLNILWNELETNLGKLPRLTETRRLINTHTLNHTLLKLARSVNNFECLSNNCWVHDFRWVFPSTLLLAILFLLNNGLTRFNVSLHKPFSLWLYDTKLQKINWAYVNAETRLLLAPDYFVTTINYYPV